MQVKGPRSMSAPTRNVIRSNDSRSLWNYTVSPGWSEEECEVLRLALMKYGVGKWAAISESNVLPGKLRAQLNLQTQRMIGQQSLGEFQGIKLDVKAVSEVNAKKEGKRKNGFLVNTGDRVTREELAQRIASNREKYGISNEEADKIVIPKIGAGAKEAGEKAVHPDTLHQWKSELSEMRERLSYLEAKKIQIKIRREELGENCPACGEPWAADPLLIGCDRCKGWFHGKCVGLETAPESDVYYCPLCEAAREARKRKWEEKADQEEGEKNKKQATSPAPAQ